MKSVASIFTAPALCLILLGGMALESAATPSRRTPRRITRGPRRRSTPGRRKIGKDWTSRAWKIPDAAVQLLRPNTTLSRRYVNVSDERQWADLLVVQCRDPNDMSGHYPPNCYPANGEPMVSERPRTWQVGDRTINGMEYQFERGDLGKPVRYCVYNFFELPGRGIVPDMQQVRRGDRGLPAAVFRRRPVPSGLPAGRSAADAGRDISYVNWCESAGFFGAEPRWNLS